MEILFEQKVNFAKIKLYKNYSIINRDKPGFTFKEEHNKKNDESINSEFACFDCYTAKVVAVDSNSGLQEILNHIKNKNNASLYFDYFNCPSIDGRFYTTKDSTIKRNYSNPFATIEIISIRRTIKKSGNKLKIQFYFQSKKRYANTKFFKKTIHDFKTLTFNLDSGNFCITIKNKKSNNYYVNNFKVLSNNYDDFFMFTKILFPSEINNARYDFKKEIFEMYDDREFIKNFCLNFGIQFSNKFVFIPNLSETDDEIRRDIGKNYRYPLLKEIIKYFIHKRKIKAPDNYLPILLNYYPTEKFLKKNDRKLIQASLDMFNLKSKILIKILHLYPKINIYNLFNICQLLGNNYQKYLATINHSFFEELNGFYQEPWTHDLPFCEPNKMTLTNDMNTQTPPNLLEVDKEHFVKFLNDTSTQKYEPSSRLVEIEDHFSMLQKIREYDPNIRMRAKNWKEFKVEHEEFTDLVSKINKGYTIEYVYNAEMLSDVEKPITIKIDMGSKNTPRYVNETFYPKILVTEEEYIEEGKFMHHCVATYAEKGSSIILSLRTQDGNDRVTCEFNTSDGTCKQAKHFCNKEAPGDFILALDDIIQKTRYYSKRGMLHYTHRRRIPLKINNKEVEREKPTPILNEDLFPRIDLF